MNRLPVLLTRPARANAEFATALRDALGPLEIVESPLVEIVPLDPGHWPGRDDALIFTSQNAVAVLAERQPGGGRRAYCVGERTAQAAREAGFDAVAGEGSVAELPEAIEADGATAQLWYLHGKHRRGDLARALRDLGHRCECVEIYDQRARPLDEAVRARLAAGEAMVAPLFSPRTAGLLAAEVKNMGANLRVVALSEAVAEAWPGAAAVAARPNAAAMLETLSRAVG